ncbi:hypothetical protein SAMN05421538_1099 [Paracoccus isoporae]|uniref:Uncharacterized protein n=1 Tax=Paracoccus isoporae TaxID=591205 RepID=A0A1G7EKI8_9RHOB|nr:hypothetical protein [Paracoccus isoporae]SDE64210.1 hypothetical protein SAMN05421538_1099 [Paracoccus isoporae]
MTRDDFILATALVLFAAFVLGWLSCWLIGRLTRPGRADLAALPRLTQELHEAERSRDAAIDEAKQREATLHERLAFSGTELANARTALSEAAQEIEELRAYIDQHLRKPR